MIQDRRQVASKSHWASRVTHLPFGYPVAAIGLVIFAVSLMAFLAACSSFTQLKGTDLGRDPAPDFQLSDQTGKAVALSDLRGKVVVLTFLYTHCPDVCPLIAEHLRTATELLGSATSQVAVVAISVDPDHDTPEAIDGFERAHRLVGRLIYLNGSHAQLQHVWQAYFVDAQPDEADPQLISHSTRVILIDKTGKQRVNLDSDFAPSDLASDVRALLDE